jgi:exo-rhamnogalacturonan lyase-like protein
LGGTAVELTVAESGGADRAKEPVTTGVPFAQGELKDVSKLTVIDAAGKPIPSHFRKTVPWPDGSVRWALMDCQVDVKAGGSVKLKVAGGKRVAPPEPVKVDDGADAVKVSTGPLEFVVDKKKFNVFRSIKVDGKELITGSGPGLVLYMNGGKKAVASGAPKEVKVEESNPMRAVVLVRGEYPGVHRNMMHYTVRITAYAGKKHLNLRVWLENSGKYGYVGRAEWFGFDGQAVELGLGLGELKKATCEGAAADAAGAKKFKVAQHNPGNNWKSFKWAVTAGGKELKTGARTGGAVALEGAGGKLNVGVRYFWENYSKAIEVDGSSLKFWLWPQDGSWPPTQGRWGSRGSGDFKNYRKAGMYHIPGCVKKGHEIILDFSGRALKASEATLRSPLMAMAAPAYYSQTDAAPGWFAPGKLKTGDDAYDKAVANWDRQALDGVDRKSKSSIWSGRTGLNYSRVRNWYGWMNFGDNGWGGGMSSLHYDWTWIMLLNYMRHGDRGFFDMGVTMERHLAEVDHLWSDRNHPLQQKMARYEFANPFIHGGLGDGRCKPNPSHNWVSGIVLYYMLTGDQMAYECAISNGVGVYKRKVARLKDKPTAGGQARESGWGILLYCSLYELTADKQYLDNALVLWNNNLKEKYKAKGCYMDRGLQYYYCTQGLVELQKLSGDKDLMKMLEEGCKGDFSDRYKEWHVFLTNIYAYVGYKQNKPEYIEKAKKLFQAYRPRPQCFNSSGAWDKESGKFIRNGHILQYVLWKQAGK